MEKQVLVVKLNMHLRAKDIQRIRKSIMEQKETGLVILPTFCDALLVPEGIDILVEEENYGGRS